MNLTCKKGIDLNAKGILQFVLQASSNAIVILSDDFTILEINPAALNFYNWKREAVLHQNYLEVCKKSNVVHVPLKLTNEKNEKDKEISHLSGDGSTKTFLWRIKTLPEKQGNLSGLMLIGNDITELKQAERQQKYIKSYFEKILEYIPGYIFWKDKESRIMGCNKNFADIAGESISSIIGKTDYDLPWTKDEAEAFVRDDKATMRSGKAKLNFEETMRQANGKERILLTNKVPLRDINGDITGVVGIFTDITERKQTEKELVIAKERAEISNQAKSNFLATVSHELRTPLNAIMGMAQILDSMHLTTEQREYIKIILLSGNNLLALINDILDFSKLEAGKLEIRSENFDPCFLIDEIKTSMSHLVEDKGIKLLVKCDKDVPRKIVGDSLRVRQIIVNLLGNAIKFTQAGQIKLSIKCESKVGSTAWIQISVEDTGIGIPKDKLEKIFERFTQVESHYSRRFGGVGLGLAICKQLVEAMGGHIRAESEINQGSIFWFVIPFPITSKTAVNSSFKIKKSKINLKEKLKINANILLVEDNLLNQKVAKIMLKNLGCQLEITSNAKEALKKLSKKSYDLILVDIGLPDVDGLRLTTEIRRRETTSRIPIIAMTAHVMEEDRKNCLAAGADDVIPKPIMQDELQDILKKWITAK